MSRRPQHWELICSRDLALRLGARGGGTNAETRGLWCADNLLVRDRRTGWPLFWDWELSTADRSLQVTRPSTG